MLTLARDIKDDDLDIGTKNFNISVNDGIFTSFARLSIILSASTSKLPLPYFERENYIVSIKENRFVVIF